MCLLTTFGSRLSTCYRPRKREFTACGVEVSRASTGNFPPQGRGGERKGGEEERREEERGAAVGGLHSIGIFFCDF